MRPFDRFFATSSNAVEMSCSRVWFKLFTGGRLSVSVAIPVLSFTDKLTRLFVADMAWPRTNDGALTMVANNGRLHHTDVAFRSISTRLNRRRYVFNGFEWWPSVLCEPNRMDALRVMVSNSNVAGWCLRRRPIEADVVVLLFGLRPARQAILCISIRKRMWQTWE